MHRMYFMSPVVLYTLLKQMHFSGETTQNKQVITVVNEINIS